MARHSRPADYRLSAHDISGLRQRLARRAEHNEAQMTVTCFLLTALLDEIEERREGPTVVRKRRPPFVIEEN
jgi:hypothetical protein